MQTVLKRRREQYRQLREAGVLPVAYPCFDGVTTTLENPQCGRFTRPRPGVPQVIGCGNAWRRQVWTTICAKVGMVPHPHHHDHGYRVGAAPEGQQPMANNYQDCGTTTAARRRRREALEALQQARIQEAARTHGAAAPGMPTQGNSIGAPLAPRDALAMQHVLSQHGYSAGHTEMDARARRRRMLEAMQQDRIAQAHSRSNQGLSVGCGLSIGQTQRDALARYSRDIAATQRAAFFGEFEAQQAVQGVSVAGQRPHGYNERQRARRAALLRANRRAMQR